MFEVYCATSPSGKRYVGFTSQGEKRRWSQHVHAAGKGSPAPLHNAIRKYGPAAFTRVLLERMSTAAGARRAECLWIKELRTQGGGGYNATAGGEGVLGWSPSEEHRAALLAANTGRRMSDRNRASLHAVLKGRSFSAGTRAKLSAALKGRRLSEGTRAKMSAGQVARHAARKKTC